MAPYFIVYHGLIFSAFVLSFVAHFMGHKRFVYLWVLLLLTFGVEIFAEIAIRLRKEFVWSYHVFNLFEYTLLVLFLLPLVRNGTIRRVVQISIPLFVGASLYMSLTFYRFSDLPALNIDLEGILLFVFCTYLLFNLDIDTERQIWYKPDLWILTGPLIFFGGTFFYNGVYTNFFHMDQSNALKLFAIVNMPLNLLLYACFNTGLLCLIIKKRYFIR
jgi:hypothetical protein